MNTTNRCRTLGLLLVASLLPFAALAQGNSAAMDAPAPVVDPCKREVMQYQGNIELVRKSLGDKAAADLQARFISKAEWDAILLKDGYCGIARKLRARKTSP